MPNSAESTKRVLISRNNSKMFIALAAAGIIFSFTVVTSVTMVKRMSYQAKVIGERTKAEKQLKSNLQSADRLLESYKLFDEAAESVIGTADKNSRVVLDALPSKYDFPALATSLEKILITGGLRSISITGTDDEALAEQNSISPAPVEIPFTVSAQGPYDKVQKLTADFQRSIRPFKILKLDISGSQQDLTVLITATTYYQPEKNLDIPQKEVE